MKISSPLFFVLTVILCLSRPLEASAENSPDKFIGRWERPGGAYPMVFNKDGPGQVGLSAAKDGKWIMIRGTYTVSDAGKLTLKAEGEGVTVTEYYFF
jgi:hypothetical protein